MERKKVVKTFRKIDKLKGIVLSYIKLSSMFNSNQNAIDSLCNSNVVTKEYHDRGESTAEIQLH